MNSGPSVFPSGRFLWIGPLIFPETQYGIRGPCVVVRDIAGFLGGEFCPQNGENRSKIGCFEFIGNFSHYFFL